MKKYKLKSIQRPLDAKYWYGGTTHAAHMDPKARAAYCSWRDQRHRCRNPSLKCYKYYGGKGVRVKYSSREFVGWWLEELDKKMFKKPTISRINHEGHYEFGNIKLEEHLENCVVDTLKRHGPPSHKTLIPVVIFDYKTSEILMICKSMTEAAKLTQVNHSNIWSICNRKKKVRSGKGFTFKYLKDHELEPR